MELSFLMQIFSQFAFGIAPQFAHYSHTATVTQGVVKRWSLPLLPVAFPSFAAWMHGDHHGWASAACQSQSIPTCPSWQGRANTRKVKVRTGRDQSPVTVQGKTNLTRGNKFKLNETNGIRAGKSEINPNLRNTCPSPLPFYWP